MKVLIVGMGEIGTSLKQVVSKYHTVCTKDTEPMEPFRVDVLHICYPYDKCFIPCTNNYTKDFDPKLTLIHTTVPVGTTSLIDRSLYHYTSRSLLAHAPIRGQHSKLVRGIQSFPMLVGANHMEDLEKAVDYLDGMGILTNTVTDTNSSELAKLLSLTQYGVNIEFARYANKCCEKFGVSYEVIKGYTESYNSYLKPVLGSDADKNHKKFNLDPPEGKIGGHCVLPGMEKINDQVPEKFISRLIEINKQLDK